jgi:hypothetical protein
MQFPENATELPGRSKAGTFCHLFAGVAAMFSVLDRFLAFF